MGVQVLVKHVDLYTVRYLFRIKMFMYFVRVKTCVDLFPGKGSYYNLSYCVCISLVDFPAN